MSGLPVNHELAVLMFHGVGEPRAELPRDEKPYWINADLFQAIVTRLSQGPIASQVVWTFDDGNDSDMKAAEVLAKAGIRGQFYVLTGRMGKPYYLSCDDVRTLDAMGMEVGLHGRDHIDWRMADEASLLAEMGDARAALSDVIAKPVTSVAIPFGAYNRRVMKRLKALDFDRIYTSDTGPSRASAHIHRRTPVMADHKVEDVVAIIEDRVSAMRKVRRAITPFIKRNFR